jgi:hypothetical protein
MHGRPATAKIAFLFNFLYIDRATIVHNFDFFSNYFRDWEWTIATVLLKFEYASFREVTVAGIDKATLIK